MKTEFKKLFLKEISKLQDAKTKKAILKCIYEVEAASDISEIKNLKKLSGYTDYYRIRLGSYRIGVAIINDVVYFVTMG